MTEPEVRTSAPPPGGVVADALTRGFLFCDLRGYTAFVETHGDRAAADLLEDYRELVRGAIAATGGGEIRTEGDSFYVVFASASAAVRCGLAIVRRATDASSRGGRPPIRVGVGIHAGESVEGREGYVGSAVNIAARVCGVAEPGEVLVTDTVRSLVRTSLPLTVRPRGRPRLKGIAEPIPLFAVTEADRTAVGTGTYPSRGRGRVDRMVATRPVAIGIGAVVIALLALGFVATSRRGPDPNASASSGPTSPAAIETSSPTAVPGASPSIETVAALPVGDGMAPHVTVPPGRYRTQGFQPTIQLDLGPGWEAVADDPDAVEVHMIKDKRGAPVGAMSFSLIQVGYEQPCPHSKGVLIGESQDDVIKWLSTRPYLDVAAPQPVNIGGVAGVRLVTHTTKTAPKCADREAGDPSGVYLFPIGQSEFYLPLDEEVEFTILPVHGRTVVMILERTAANAAAFDAEVATILGTLEFP